MSSGLIIGKFMPPHAGHGYLIDCARQQVTSLDLVLFTKTSEPIPGQLRAAWLRELYPDLAIHHLHLDHHVNFDDEAAWDYWVRAIRTVMPSGPDLVFSSEQYGDELARRLGADHVLVDAARARVPVSASQIRADPLANWDYLPLPVRSHYVRRVCLLGAESTGKTMLATALAEHFRTVWVPEYARAYLSANGNVVTPADMPRIARGQAGSEERLARQASRVLICDTNCLTTQLWHEYYFGQAPAEITELADSRMAHLYLVTGLDVPWVADNLRDSPGQREHFHQRFCEELTARGLPFIVLDGPHEHRLRQAVAAVEGLLAQKLGPA